MPSRSSGRNSWLSSVLTNTTSPAVNWRWLQPYATSPIPNAIIVPVMNACPMFSHASEFSLRTAAFE